MVGRDRPNLPTRWGGTKLDSTPPPNLPTRWGGTNLASPHGGEGRYSTVTLLARLRGWSTFWPSSTATWYANICSTTELRIAAAASSVRGMVNRSVATPSSEVSPSVTSASTGASRAT